MPVGACPKSQCPRNSDLAERTFASKCSGFGQAIRASPVSRKQCFWDAVPARHCPHGCSDIIGRLLQGQHVSQRRSPPRALRRHRPHRRGGYGPGLAGDRHAARSGLCAIRFWLDQCHLTKRLDRHAGTQQFVERLSETVCDLTTGTAVAELSGRLFDEFF